ncbi:SPASM domain-containing protein [Bradyrhizobium barranii]|uniref:SPASM domain-containing protein n=1 Tax=Bradyrhizobium barranii TaxID=2992140 RepID=A0ABY3QWY2_9BRAD|nr:radical SAM protein [Bradyrhizobium japonicum]UFW90529.1 SPASM domain-containing protein [Bradyrhizobium japonicum]
MGIASVTIDAARPKSPDAHLLKWGDAAQLFLPDGSQLFDIDEALAEALDGALQSGDGGITLKKLLAGLDVLPVPDRCSGLPEDRRVRALSLAVAQSCNLGCSYCYAQGGGFGSAPKGMSLETARAAIDLMLGDTRPGERANLAFLGGEPLMGRDVIHDATYYAARRASERGIKLSFSITTNGTLVGERDIELFDKHGFAVTVSLDGAGAAHDRQRPFKGGRGSYARIIERIAPLVERAHRCQVSARVTVTPRNLGLSTMLEELISFGFHSVGFSPMLSAPDAENEMQHDHLVEMLEQMMACGRVFEARTIAGERYPFLNLLNGLREIHRGTHRPYPCGAGAGYLGVSADGELAACHRFIDAPEGAMGNLADGVDRVRQTAWLEARHVHEQSGCRSCWARYLCSGGCHHETLSRGRPACDFIRGWLHYVIGAYGRLTRARPDFVGQLAR